MTRPGEQLRALVTRAFGEAFCRQVIDPIVADLQHEYSMVPPERRWRQRVVHARGLAAALHGLASVGLRRISIVLGRSLGRPCPIGVALAVGLASTLGATVGIAGLDVLATRNHSASRFYLLALLIPSAFSVAAPVGIAAMTALWSARHRRARATLWISALVASVLVGWSLNHLVPDANQTFRTVLYADLGRAPSRGATELSFEELLHVSWSRKAQAAYGLEDRTGEPPPVFWLHARVALTMTPLVVTLIAFATTTGGSLARQRTVLACSASALLAWYLLISRDTFAVVIESGTPPWLAAWLPNLALTASALAMWAQLGNLSRRRPSDD